MAAVVYATIKAGVKRLVDRRDYEVDADEIFHALLRRAARMSTEEGILRDDTTVTAMM